MAGKRYPSDLTDAQWQRLEPPIPPAKPGGSARRVDMRKVLNGICFVTREGCRWRALPHDFPAWQTMYWYLSRWTADGSLVRLHDLLRGRVREAAGRATASTAVIIDIQSVKNTAGGMWAMMRGRR